MNTNESVEQLDPTDNLTVEIIKKRTISGVLILTVRTFFIQLISFFATILLTFFLEPAQFGVFFLVSAIINFLAYFSDIGFAASLIQKKEKLTNKELKTIFSAQQLLVIVLMLIVFVSTPILQSVYKFNLDAIYLLWALTFSLLLSSLKTIPSVLLERRLDFNKLVIPQIAETVLFNIVAVYFAWKGFGIASYTIAVLVRGFSGLILIYILQPWIPGLAFSKNAFRSLLKFGIPYQANTFMAMIKDDGMTLLLGGILGSSGLGLLGWAQKWAFAPLRFFMDQVIRVTFPAFSRLQDDKDELSNSVSKSILFICLLVYPSLVLLVLLGPVLVDLIPKYQKWKPALTALSLISITSAFAAITTPLTNMLTAIGKISITFKLMVMWTTLTWLLVPILSFTGGINGAALGFAIVGSSSIFALYIAAKFVNLNFFQIAGKPLFAAIFMGIVVYYTRGLLAYSLTGVIFMLVTGCFAYIAAILFLEPKLIALVKNNLKFLKK